MLLDIESERLCINCRISLKNFKIKSCVKDPSVIKSKQKNMLIFNFAYMCKFLQLYRFVPVVLPLDQQTLLYDLNPQPGYPSTTGWGPGWGGLRPSLLGWTILDDLNVELRQVDGWGLVGSWPSQWTHHCIAIHDSTARLRQGWGKLRQAYWAGKQ